MTPEFNADLGAMTTTRQVELVKAHIADALIQRGAEVFAQSACPEGPQLAAGHGAHLRWTTPCG